MRHTEHGTQIDASPDAGVVMILDSERGPDASLLMSHLAARQRPVEVVRDEVSAMRRLIRGGVDLMVIMVPTSQAASNDLQEAVSSVDHPPAIAGWDPQRRALRSLTQSAPSPPIAMPTPAATVAAGDAWGDWDATPEVLSSAELDALLGGMEPSQP
ncbi:MAG: hypothetical protein AAF586_05810 [Planctomycetota bacterium]